MKIQVFMAILVQHEYPRFIGGKCGHGVKCSRNGLILRWYSIPPNITSTPSDNVIFYMNIVLEPSSVCVEL